MILTDEQNALKDLAARAAKQHIEPVLNDDEENRKFRREIIREFGKLGLTGIPSPEEYEGGGLGYAEYIVAVEEIAKVSVGYAVSIGVSGLPQVILAQFGTEKQKKKCIPPLARGEHIGAFALSESHAGSDPGAMKTRAVKKGDKYIITGTKLWITQGNEAETMIVFARTGGEGTKGISAFLVEKGMKGYRHGKIEHKMGINISPTCEMIFEELEVPAENLVGQEGMGFKIAMAALDSGRITIGASATGVATAAMEYCANYAKEREQFGQPIAQFQGVQFMLADMYTGTSASRLMVQKAALLKDSGLAFSRDAAAAKVFATDNAMRVTTDAVQVLGGAGYTKEYPVERYMREAKVLQIVEGTNQIQRIVIGRSL